jgi:hypothetical protein
LVVVLRITGEEQFRREIDDVSDPNTVLVDTPAKALTDALRKSLDGDPASEGGGVAQMMNRNRGPAAGTLRVVVGPKPLG